MKRLFKYFIILSVMLISAACEGQWVDSYWLTFLREDTSVMVLRYLEEGQWKETTGVGDSKNSKFQSDSFKGVGLAGELGGFRSVLGYTFDKKLFIHEGLSLEFGRFPQKPDRELIGDFSAPTIIHIEDDNFLIAVTQIAPSQPQDQSVRLLPYTIGQGFGNQITFIADGNSNVRGRPAIAYHDGKLVVAWGRTTTEGVRDFAERQFRYAVANYQPGDINVTVSASGFLWPNDTSGPSRTGPALAYNGAGIFYLAFRDKNNGIRLFSSTDGVTWDPFNDVDPTSGDPYLALGGFSIAAQPSGEILLAVTGGGGEDIVQTRTAVVGKFSGFKAIPDGLRFLLMMCLSGHHKSGQNFL